MATAPPPATVTTTKKGPLQPVVRKKIQAVTKGIDSLKNDARRVDKVSRQELEEVADKYSRAPSTFLAAIVGGVVGSAGGIALGTIGTGALVLTGPLGLALGAALGVLAFRGKSYWKLEKTTQKTRGAAEFIRSQIDSLPPDAPPGLRNDLYDELGSILRKYSTVADKLIDD